MRVLHCCLAAFYVDDFGYQENILPREHLRQGHEVEVLASTETYGADLKLTYKPPSRYLSSDGFWVTRIPYVRWLPARLARKLRMYRGVQRAIARFKPDVIFLHDLQFLSIFSIVSFCKKSPSIRLFVDCHTDTVNSGRSFVSRWVLHKVIYRLCAMAVASVARRFWATLPARADFLSDFYGVPLNRISLLPFGADDGRVGAEDRVFVRAKFRASWGIGRDDFVFVFGGKIDERKNVSQLLKAFSMLPGEDPSKKAWLIIFGRPVAAIEPEFTRLVAQDRVVNLQWVPAYRTHEVFWASDFAVFPGTHSVLWEEAAGFGLPIAVKRWKGIEHVDVGGNCIFLETADVSEIYELLRRVVDDRSFFESMRRVSSTVAVEKFSYTKIAARALHG